MMYPKRILVIDDDQDFNSYVRIVLEAGGYRVETAQTVVEGLRALHRTPPDLVIADVMLARSMNGLSIDLEIKTDERLTHIPILMVSAIVSTEDDDLLGRSEDGGSVAFMSKPIAPSELLKRVSEMVKRFD
ncbi:MAG: response regulator [Chloroflexi bacterium]|nr:response regulator [Chloroflexota bacterium]